VSKCDPQKRESSSRLIDAKIMELGDWRGVPVWYYDRMICTGETYRNVVKMTFAKGASQDDPARRG
jgi:hypothetical protein